MKRPVAAFIIIVASACALGGAAAFRPRAARADASGAASSTAADTAASSSSLQAQLDANNQQIALLSQEIANYQQKLQQVGADKQTLKAAIAALDLRRNEMEAQTAITEREINITQLEISRLGGEISDTEQTLLSERSSLGEYLLNLQKDENQSLIMRLLSSNDITQAWSDTNAILQAQDAVQNQMKELQAQESGLANSQTTSQEKQATLVSQQQSLAAQQAALALTVQSKSELLAATNAQESKYQALLSQAEGELQGFSTFTKNAGGSALVGTETKCDAWGCYYNQRDSAWGSDQLDGTRFTLASDGCLVTSMAMVMTHYGYRDVTPVTINSDPYDFASYYPAYLLMTISVDGATVSRITSRIDAVLATGNPVVVGLRAYGGTHYVVLTSGHWGHYLMRDPYITNADDVPFSDYYSLRQIFRAWKVAVKK